VRLLQDSLHAATLRRCEVRLPPAGQAARRRHKQGCSRNGKEAALSIGSRLALLVSITVILAAITALVTLLVR